MSRAAIKISVLIPFYNSQNTIARAVNSVLKQSLVPFEILLYDDCSTDSSVSMVDRIKSSCTRIKIFKGKRNYGAGYARKFLINKAKGDLIAFLDSDDVWYERKLEKQVLYLEKGSADICVCSYHIKNERGELIGERNPPKTINFLTLHFSNWIPTSMSLFRADLIGVHQMPIIRLRQDYAYWLKIFKLNKGLKCVVVKEVHGFYQRADSSISSNWKRNLRANFFMFKDTMQYSFLASCTFVFFNIIIRIFRK